MNKRKLACFAAAPLLMALGFFLPLMLLPTTLSFIGFSLVAMAQEIIMFGLPALLLLKGLGHQGTNRLITLKKPEPMDAGLSMLSAVAYVLTGSLLGAIVYTMLTSFGLTIALPEAIIPKTPAELLAGTLAIALVTAVCEELFFRGALPLLLKRKLGDRWSVAICSVLFAVLHFSLVGFPTLLLFAWLMHRLYRVKQNLLLPILFHAMYNFSILLLNYVGASPGISLTLLSVAVFVLATRFNLREENHEVHHPGL